jgi:hypothetical protein
MFRKELKPNDPEQSKRLIDTAREREADETEEFADKVFFKVAKPLKNDKDRS